MINYSAIKYVLRHCSTVRIHRKSNPRKSQTPGLSSLLPPKCFTSEKICEDYPSKVTEVTASIRNSAEAANERATDRVFLLDRYLKIFQRLLESTKRTIVPVGSSVSRMADSSSDLDIVLMPFMSSEECSTFIHNFEQHNFKKNYMDGITNVIQKSSLIRTKSIERLYSTHVPIIKLETTDGLTVDIQFGNPSPIRTALHLRTCVEYDPRVRMLCTWLNTSLSKAQLKNSRNGLFSTYFANMLVVHFLSSDACKLLPDFSAICPVLSPSSDWTDVAAHVCLKEPVYVPLLDVNDISAGKLLVQMIDYYASIDLHRLAIHTNGKVFLRKDSDDSRIFLVDAYHPPEESRSQTANGVSMIHEYFSSILSELKTGSFRSLI